jgi:hypothetical protein
MGPDTLGDPIDPNVQYSEPPPWYGAPVVAPLPPHNPYQSNSPYQPYDPYNVYRGLPAARPGSVATASVLCLITAALLLISGFIVIFAASTLDQNTFDSDSANRVALFIGVGLVSVLDAITLIAGGVLLLARFAAARTWIPVGTVVCLALGVFWLTQSELGSLLVWFVIFCGPTVIATILALTTRVTAWLSSAPVTDSPSYR